MTRGCPLGQASQLLRLVRHVRRLAGSALLGLLGVALFAELGAAGPLDPSARLPEGNSSTEQWDLTAQLDSGHRLVARFVITNIGPGERNAVVLGHVIRPGGSSQLFKQGRRRNRWKLSDDRRVLDVGSSDLFLRDPSYRLRIGKRDVKIDLSFSPDVGEATPPEATPAGYSLELLALSARAQGTLWLPEMSEPLAVKGHMALVHSWTSRPERKIVQRRIEVHKLAEGTALYALDLTTPQGKRSRWMVASDSGTIQASTTHFKANLNGSLSDSVRRGYWIPSEIRLSEGGVSGGVRLRKTLLESDPLGVLPGFVRWVVSLTTKPHRVWAESEIEVTLRPHSGTTPLQVHGTGITSLTFLNPLERD